MNIARKIVDALPEHGEHVPVLEIGPGTGVLTQYLANRGDLDLKLVEIDRESISYLHKKFTSLKHAIIEGDFLELDLGSIFNSTGAPRFG